MSQDKIGPQILVIDNEIGNCTAVQDYLGLYGYEVAYALNPSDGFESLDNHDTIDVVLLAANLGSGMTGIDALSVIKKRYNYVQVIMCTSMNDSGAGPVCLHKGAFDSITKPWDENKLLHLIAVAVERKKTVQMNDLYLSILVHDLKNPLQNIIGAIDVIRYSLEETLSDHQKRFLASAELGVGQIKTMLNNILSVSKFERGVLTARRELFSVMDAVDETLAQFTGGIGDSGKCVVLEAGIPYGFTVCADRDFFVQVLTNMIRNGLGNSPGNSEVTLGLVATEQEDLRVSVTNRGSYIGEDDRAAIFDTYSNVTIAPARSNNMNAGLAMTYCKMAVDAMGGTILVESDKEIPQTTFHFTVKNHKE